MYFKELWKAVVLQSNRNQDQQKILKGGNRESSVLYIKVSYAEKTNSSFKYELQIRSYKGRCLEFYSLTLVLKLCFWGYHIFNTMGTVPPGIRLWSSPG